MCVCVCVCVFVQCDIYLFTVISIFMSFALVVPEKPVVESAMCVRVPFNYFALVLSLLCQLSI